MTKLSRFALAIGALAVTAGTALAATDSANLSVGATVQNACAIGPGTLSFGSNLALAVTAGAGTIGSTAAVDADSGTSVEVVCTLGATAAITGDFGANFAGSVRKMISGTDLLTYELYTTTGRTTILNPASIAYTGTGANDNVAIFGRITGAALAAAKKGSYTDTVALTITYTP